MAVYRFRVQFEDYDEIYRDIEIKSTQTFKELHEAIQHAINFDNKHAASFFISDAYWRKGTEITLLKDDLEEGVRHMEKTKIASCVEDPHQRFVYVYDKTVTWTLNIELLKITKEEKGNFPTCIKSVGVAPKQYKPAGGQKGDEPLSKEAGMAALLQAMENDDDAYKNADNGTEEILDEEEARGVIGNAEEQDDNEYQEENEESDENDEYGPDEFNSNYDEEDR
ncbi:MAG: IS1096 element passenger TnpR family protein [Bacteroidota bacterium]|jgi:hypothetical protein